MAFSSNAPRFSAKAVDESETFLGPGYYEQKSCFNQERSRTGQGAKARSGIAGNTVLASGSAGVQAASQNALAIQSGNTKSQNFLSSAGRFGSPDRKNAQNVTPGPGHYSQENVQKWFKRSYNMNFSEI